MARPRWHNHRPPVSISRLPTSISRPSVPISGPSSLITCFITLASIPKASQKRNKGWSGMKNLNLGTRQVSRCTMFGTFCREPSNWFRVGMIIVFCCGLGSFSGLDHNVAVVFQEASISEGLQLRPPRQIPLLQRRSREVLLPCCQEPCSIDGGNRHVPLAGKRPCCREPLAEGSRDSRGPWHPSRSCQRRRRRTLTRPNPCRGNPDGATRFLGWKSVGLS